MSWLGQSITSTSGTLSILGISAVCVAIAASATSMAPRDTCVARELASMDRRIATSELSIQKATTAQEIAEARKAWEQLDRDSKTVKRRCAWFS